MVKLTVAYCGKGIRDVAYFGLRMSVWPNDLHHIKPTGDLEKAV